MTDERDELQNGPVLNADGQVEGKAAPTEPSAPAPMTPSTEPELELQLTERAPRKVWEEPPAYRPEPEPRTRWRGRRLALAALLIAAALTATVFAVGQSRPKGRSPADDLQRVLHLGPAPPMVVDSEPGGAQLLVNGRPVGTTPWAGNNEWQGDSEVSVILKGYAPWSKRFEGRTEVHLNAKLRREK